MHSDALLRDIEGKRGFSYRLKGGRNLEAEGGRSPQYRGETGVL